MRVSNGGDRMKNLIVLVVTGLANCVLAVCRVVEWLLADRVVVEKKSENLLGDER